MKELGRGSKAGLRPFCPCTRCGKRQRKGKDDMIKHLWSYGYMPGFTTAVDFAEHERESGRVMRQRINGNADDGIRNFLNDLRDAHMPDSPPSYEEPPEHEEPCEEEDPCEPEEPEPTAKAYYDMMELAGRPLYEGAKISQLDAISQVLAKKLQYGNTRSCFEDNLQTYGNMLPEGNCLPKSMYETKKILRELNMDYEKIDCCPKGCILFRKQFANDKYCTLCGASRYHEVKGVDGQKTQTKVAVKILRYLPFIKRIQRLYMNKESATQMTWHKTGKRYEDE